MAVDRSSPEFMFGQITAQLAEGQRTMLGLTEEIKRMNGIVGSLPCALEDKRVGDLEKWRQDCDSQSLRTSRYCKVSE